MRRIGILPRPKLGKSIPRESGQTSNWSFTTRKPGKSIKEAKQMSAELSIPAGAASPNSKELEWHKINWYKVNQNVRRLQARIVEATRAGRWGKVKALQHLLTHSFSGKALAVRRVTENPGKNTPGIDHQIWNSPKKKVQAVRGLKQHGYRPQPLRRIYIPKSSGKQRPLSIACLGDRAMQALYLLALDPIAETTADHNSYGFRTQRSTADAIEQCFNVLATKRAPQWILEADILSCFDQIGQEWLIKNIPMEKAILVKWLKAGFMEKQVWYPTSTGVSQGSPISPTIANLVLDGLEKKLQEAFPKKSQQGRRAKVNLVRFADDFIITGATKEVLEGEVKPLVIQFLADRNLQLSEEKTRVVHIESGFDFLAQNIRKYQHKLLIKPSNKSVKSLLQKVRELVKANKQAPAGRLIAKLNPLIRGWANYHQHVVSKRVFNKVDDVIFRIVWHWAKRRHPHKNTKWVKAKYFPSSETRSWNFRGVIVGRQKQPQPIQLYLASSLAIKRHTKIRSEANPYDPQWENYFDQRLAYKWLEGGKRQRLVTLWKWQSGNCPQCGQKITRESGWQMHHLIPRVYGGTDKLSNLVLVHPNCHRQIHSGARSEELSGEEENPCLRKA